MKKILNEIILFIFRDFKSFRKKTGGTWYNVYDRETATGFAPGATYWTRQKPIESEEVVIKKIEKY